MRFFGAEAHESPTDIFEVFLAHGVVFSATFHVVNAAVDLDRNAGSADGEIHCVSSDPVLAHDMHAFVPQQA